MKVEIIGYDSGWGSKDHGTEDGPDAVNIGNILKKLLFYRVEAKWRGTLGIKYIEKSRNVSIKNQALPHVTEGVRRLAMHTHLAAGKSFTPVVIGGDRSSSVGTWSGIISSLDAFEKFGLIFISPRFYAHTEKTVKNSDNDIWWNEQSTPALMGEGVEEFTTVCSRKHKLSPENMVFIGVRETSPEEEAFIKINNIKVFTMDEVKQKGFESVFKEAIDIVSANTSGFGISIDMGGFDPKFAPGTSNPVENGIIASEFLDSIKGIGHNSLIKGIEITEFNPYKDENHQTSALITEIITNTFAK